MKPSRRHFLKSLSAGALRVPAECLAPLLPSAMSPLLGARPSSPHFVDVARQAGLNVTVRSGDPRNKKHLIEMTGCGVAFFDYDHDGWPDIFFVNSASFGTSDPGPKPTNCLFHNNRDGTFTDVTAQLGLARTGWGQGCCVGDFDNDGLDDLFVTYWGENVLFRNRGRMGFEDATARAGLRQTERRWNTGCCFLDYDRDGWLDLFVANYIQFDPVIDPGAGASVYCQLNGQPTACGPRGFAGGVNLLYRNRGDGTFEDVTQKARIGDPQGRVEPKFLRDNWTPRGTYGFAALASDFDNDGWPDIFVASDSAPSLLYLNNRDGTFRERGVEAGCAYNEDGREQGGMGAAAADYDGDGLIDLVKTNFSDDTTSLYRNLGNGQFEDATARGGLSANTRFLGWGAGFADLDNDGRNDIFLANGHIYPEIAKWFPHLSYRYRKVIYRNAGNGRFTDISEESGPGASMAAGARGCAFGDFDNDGDIDVVVSNLDDRPSLLRNDASNGAHWVKVKCVGVHSNRSAIGARVYLTAGGRTQMGEVQSGSSYVSQNDLRLHFGLGPDETISRLEIRWLGGKADVYSDVKADRIYVAVEGKSLQPWRSG